MMLALLPRLVCRSALAVVVALPLAATSKPADRADAVSPVPADQPIPAIDFFRPSLFSGAQLNPAGTLIAALNPGKNDSKNLVVYDLASQKFSGTGGGEGFDIYSFQWLNDQRLLFRLTKEKLYAYALFAGDATKLGVSAIALNRNDVAIPIGTPRADPLKPLVWLKQTARYNGEDGGVVQLDSLRDLDGRGGGPLIRSFPKVKGGVVVSYDSDQKGELAYATTVDQGVATLHRLTLTGWQTCPVKMDDLKLLAPGDHPGELIVLAPDDDAGEARRPRVLRRLDTITGKLGAVLHRDDTHEPYPATIHTDPDNDRILGLTYTRKGPETVWFDPAYAKLQGLLNASLPGVAARIIDSDRSKKKFLVRAASDRDPGRLYLLETSPMKLNVLVTNRPWIDPARMVEMQVLSYRTRDGFQIEGYYSAPAHLPAGTLPPLIVLAHGGPWERDTWGWNPEVQFLASRGYAVFQPNYRGSSGYTWRFPDSDIWAFRKMHDDVTDGVRVLVKSKLVDPDRIAIMGGSFGGYLAVCGAAFEGSLYRCAVTIAGIFDWAQVMRDARNSEISRAQYSILRRNLGDPKTQQTHFEEISPLRSADKITIPVFIAHGYDDPVASVGESKRLIRALEKNHIPHEVMLKGGEGHGFNFLENRVELFTRLETFLAQNLKPRPAGTTP